MATSTPVSSAAPPPSAACARAGLGADNELYLYGVALAPKKWSSHWRGAWEPCRLSKPERGARRAPNEPTDVILEEARDDGR